MFMYLLCLAFLAWSRFASSFRCIRYTSYFRYCVGQNLCCFGKCISLG